MACVFQYQLSSVPENVQTSLHTPLPLPRLRQVGSRKLRLRPVCVCMLDKGWRERAFALTEHAKLCLLFRGHCEPLVISLSHVFSVHRQTERCSCQTKLSCDLQPQKPLGYGNSPYARPMPSLPHSRGVHLLGILRPVVAHLADSGWAQDCAPPPWVFLLVSLWSSASALLPAFGFLLSWVGGQAINVVMLIHYWD